jgi:phosphoenolpyruvate phosphomutase
MQETRFFWGVYDAISAAVVDEAGGQGLWLSSLCCSAACGLPDSDLVGLGDLLGCIRAIRRATSLPLWIDCGTGFGSAANLAVAAHDLRLAGADAVCVEDKVFPKRNTFTAVSQPLEDMDRFGEKIARAKGALAGSSCLVIARTEALAFGEPLEMALHRAACYAEAGADALLLSNPSTSAASTFEFLVAWGGRLPVVLIPTSYRLDNPAELPALGVSVAIYANQLLRASVTAMGHLLESFRADHASVTRHEEMISVPELLRLTDKRLL